MTRGGLDLALHSRWEIITVLILVLVIFYSPMRGHPLLPELSDALTLAMVFPGFIFIILRIHPYKLSILKPVAAGAIVSVVIFITKRYIFSGSITVIWLIVLIIIFLLLYTVLLLIFRLNQEDKMIMNMIS